MVIGPDDAGGHLAPLEVAEHAEGLLESERSASVETHLSSCTQCRDLAASIAGVTTALAAQPREVPIPEGVAARIDATLADEAAARTAPSRRRSGSEGFWSTLRGRLPAIAAAAASVAVLGLIGYAVTDGMGGDDADSTAGTAADMDESAESEDSGDDAGATMDAPAEAAPESAPEADRDEFDADDESATTQNDDGGYDSGDGEQAETFGDADVTAREQDALTAELQDLVAERTAESEPGEDGQPCGTVLSEELGGELLGAAGTDLIEPGSVLVAIDLRDADTVSGWILPDCTAGPDAAFYTLDAPRPE